MTEPLPRPPGPLWGLVSRPSWRELRIRGEREAVERDPIWTGVGVPEGRGRRLILVPGFFAGTKSMSQLEPWLQRCGWDTRRAPIGRNDQPSEEVLAILEDWLAATVEDEGGPVPVIGHSRGGQEARVLAVRRPEAISLLVTLGAPLQVLYPPHLAVRGPAAVYQFAAWARRTPVDVAERSRFEADRTAPFPDGVRFVSIHSRTDGFLDWRICLDPVADNVAIDCTHFGLTASVAAFTAIAAALRRLDG